MDNQILNRIIRYCNYQPRCHKEVRAKLYDIGCCSTDVESYIVLLIQSGHLNEEQYARAFARGKFKLKKWGRQKIIQELKADRISDYCIKKAMTEIDDEEYITTIYELFNRKLGELKREKNKYILKNKLYNYLYQKGYESGIVQDILNDKIIK